MTHHLRTRRETRVYLASLLDAVVPHEVLAFETIDSQTSEPLDTAYLTSARNRTVEDLRRGVRHRTVTSSSSVADPRVRQLYWQPVIAAGDEVRVAAQQLPKMLIVAGHVTAVADPSGRCDAIVTRDPLLIDVARQSFEIVWSGAPDFKPTDAARLTENQVLTMLLEGATDADVARALFLSERTVRRIVAAQMLKYGARSRMQLGWMHARTVS